MHAQILLAQLKKDAFPTIQEKINAWKDEVGFKIPGCTKIVTAFEKEGNDRLLVTVLFNSTEALSEFAGDWKTLKLFDDSKSLFTGRVQYFDAVTEVTDLE